jgi:hypothetical protein
VLNGFIFPGQQQQQTVSFLKCHTFANTRARISKLLIDRCTILIFEMSFINE